MCALCFRRDSSRRPRFFLQRIVCAFIVTSFIPFPDYFALMLWGLLRVHFRTVQATAKQHERLDALCSMAIHCNVSRAESHDGDDAITGDECVCVCVSGRCSCLPHVSPRYISSASKQIKIVGRFESITSNGNSNIAHRRQQHRWLQLLY